MFVCAVPSATFTTKAVAVRLIASIERIMADLFDALTNPSVVFGARASGRPAFHLRQGSTLHQPEMLDSLGRNVDDSEELGYRHIKEDKFPFSFSFSFSLLVAFDVQGRNSQQQLEAWQPSAI